MRIFRVTAMAVLIAGTEAQTAPPQFEVASVQQCKTEPHGGRGKGGGGGGGIRRDPGMLLVDCPTLHNLIRDAYLAHPEGKPWAQSIREPYTPLACGLTSRGCNGCGRRVPPISQQLFSEHIKGAPGWIEAERYSIEAKPAPGTPEMMALSLDAASLGREIQLNVRRETKDVPVYELRAAKEGRSCNAAGGGLYRVGPAATHA
jgi:hypothetical protein